MRVIGTAGSNEGVELVKKQGAMEVYNHKDVDYIEKIKEAHPSGIDIILEMNGQTNLNKDIELLKVIKGRIVVCFLFANTVF